MAYFDDNPALLHGAHDVARRHVLPHALIDDLAQQAIVSPGQIPDLDDELWPDPMDRDSTRGEPKRVERGGATRWQSICRPPHVFAPISAPAGDPT
jgi:hypothetical protein